MTYFHLFFWRQILPFLIAQTPSPTVKPSPALDVTLLQAQLEFFKDANSRLAGSFQSFTTTVNLVLVFLTTVLGILGAIAFFLYGKTLKEAKETIETQVRQEVERSISRTLKRRVDNLERVLTREDIVSLVEVDYLLPTAQEIQLPLEFTLLRDRGFLIRPRFGLNNYRPQTDVTVLDLVNCNSSPEDIKKTLTQIKDRLFDRSVLVIYVIGHYPEVNELGQKTRYSTPANFTLRLIGTVVDAAYVAHTLRDRTEI
ncbi:MAG: hypothetical protein KME42_25065 [Tildeniella nuda ZEHNDER 1965/U140]|jgi:hypothetical protein|nr:hypothetical protein [Tildeniella nuda ZEHNDER 1965/U140]